MLLSRLWRRTTPFCFADLDDLGPTHDGILTLTEPSPAGVDAFLLACSRADCRGDAVCQFNATRFRAEILRTPRGHEHLLDHERKRLHAYRFWMHVNDPANGFVGFGGSINLRIGGGPAMARYVGHVGYGVFPPCRGQRLAERATRLLYPLARHHGLTELSITCDPDNKPSRRTIERLGGELMEIVDVPRNHPLHTTGEIRKCRYRVPI